MRQHWFPKPYADAVMRLRVPSGFLLAISFALLAEPRRQSLLVGFVLGLAGLALRAWAAGHLAKNQNLASSGPFAWTRNPLYLGTLFVALGLAIAASSWIVLAIVVAVFTFVYIPVIEQEEQHLMKIFPDYAAYAERVPILFPRVPAGLGAGRFQSALYWKNEEWKAGLAFLAGMGYLTWKM